MKDDKRKEKQTILKLTRNTKKYKTVLKAKKINIKNKIQNRTNLKKWKI